MSLYDDNTTRKFAAATSFHTETDPSAASDVSSAQPADIPQPAPPVPAAEDKPSVTASNDDFAAALETFTTEVEEQQASEDHVLKGTVLKLTPTHVVVDIGAKSEGMLPLAEVLDHDGKPKVQPGDEIDVMREKGETEEGYINLAHRKPQRIHCRDEIETAPNEKRSPKAR